MAKRKVRIYKDPNGKGEYRSKLKNFLFLAQAGGVPQQAAAQQQGAQQQGMSPAEQEQLYNYVYESIDIEQADPNMLFETLTKQGLDPNLVKSIIELSIKRIVEARKSDGSEEQVTQANRERDEAIAEREMLEQEQQEAAAAEEQLMVDQINQDSSMSDAVNQDDQVDEMLDQMDDEVVEETVEEDIPDAQDGGAYDGEDVQNIDEVVIEGRKPGFGSEKFTKEDKQAARKMQFQALANTLTKDNPNMSKEEFLEKYRRAPSYKNLSLDQLANWFDNRKMYRTQARNERKALEKKNYLWDKYHTKDGKVDTDKIGLNDWSRMYVREGLAEVDPRTVFGYGPQATYDAEEARRIWNASPYSALLRGLYTGDTQYTTDDLPVNMGGKRGIMDELNELPVVGSLFPTTWQDQTKAAAISTAFSPFGVGPAAVPSAITFGGMAAKDIGEQVYDKIQNPNSDFDYESAALQAFSILPFTRGKLKRRKKPGKQLSMFDGDGAAAPKSNSKIQSGNRFFGMGQPVKGNPNAFKDFKTLKWNQKLGKFVKPAIGLGLGYGAYKAIDTFVKRPNEAEDYKKPYDKLNEQQKELKKQTEQRTYQGPDIKQEMKKQHPEMEEWMMDGIIERYKDDEQILRDNLYDKQWLDTYGEAPSSSPLPMETMAQKGGVISKKQYVKQGMKNFQAGGQEVNNATPWNVNNETGTREAQKNVLVNYAQTNVAKDQEKKRLEAEYDAMMAQQQQMYNPPMGEEVIDMTSMQEEIPSAQFGGGKQRRMLRRATRPIRKMMRRGMMMPGVSEIDVTRSGIFGNPKEYSMTMDPAYSGLMGMMGNPMMMMQGMLSSMGMPYQYTVPFITQSNKQNTTTKAEQEVQMRNTIPDIEKQGRMASDYAGHDPVIGETQEAYFARTGRDGDEFMEAFSEEDMTRIWSGDDWKLPTAQFGGFTDQESGLTKFIYGGDEDGGIPRAQFGYAHVDEDLTDEERIAFSKTPEFANAARYMLDEDLEDGGGSYYGTEEMKYGASDFLDYDDHKAEQLADYYDKILTNQGAGAFQKAINKGQDNYISAIPFADNANPFPAKETPNTQMQALENYVAPKDLRQQGYLSNSLRAQEKYLGPGEQYSDVNWGMKKGGVNKYQKAGATQYTWDPANSASGPRPYNIPEATSNEDMKKQQAWYARDVDTDNVKYDPEFGMMSPTQEVQDQRAAVAKKQQQASQQQQQQQMMQQQMMQQMQGRGMRQNYPSMGRGRNLFGNFMSANPAFSYAGSYAQPIYNKRSGSPFMGMVPQGANLQKIDVTKSGIFGRPKRWTATYGTGAPKLYGVDDDGNRASSEEQDTRSRAERRTDNLLDRKDKKAENKYERNRRRAIRRGVGDDMLSYQDQKAEEAEIARQDELDYQNAIDNVQDDNVSDAEMNRINQESDAMDLQEFEDDFAKEEEADRNAAMADIDQRMKFGKTGNFGSAATGKSYNAFPPSRITTPVNVKGQGRGERVLMDGSDATTFNPIGTGMPTLQNRNPEVERPFNANMLQNQSMMSAGADGGLGPMGGSPNPFIEGMGNPSMAYGGWYAQGGPMIDEDVYMTDEEIRAFMQAGGVVEYI